MARLAEIMGIIAPRTANRTNEGGKNIRHYERGRDVSTNTGPAGFRQIETYLRTVPTIVIAHTFCASPDTRISYRQCLLIQGYFCAV